MSAGGCEDGSVAEGASHVIYRPTRTRRRPARSPTAMEGELSPEEPATLCCATP